MKNPTYRLKWILLFPSLLGVVVITIASLPIVYELLGASIL